MQQLRDKVAIVTGASRGIGAAIAYRFAAEGARVVITARTLEPDGKLPGSLGETAERIRALGAEVHCVQADLSEPASRARIVPEAVERFGGVDILVNNAGAMYTPEFRRLPFMELSADEFDANIALNLKSVFLVSQAAVPAMLERGGGAIVNISSTAARSGEPPQFGTAVYSAAKAGVVAFTRCMAMELGPAIRVNCILPGPTNNPATRNRPAHVLKVIQDATALGRAGEPEDIAGAVVYFASDASKWTTGASLDVDGGLRSLRPPSSSSRPK